MGEDSISRERREIARGFAASWVQPGRDRRVKRHGRS